MAYECGRDNNWLTQNEGRQGFSGGSLGKSVVQNLVQELVDEYKVLSDDFFVQCSAIILELDLSTRL